MSLFLPKKKIFMKNYTKKENVKLIKLVQQNECLWNCKHLDYFNKSIAQKAWKNIAEMVNDTPLNTQQRWRVIRNMFGRNTNPLLKNKFSKYYLEPYLGFIRPFIRVCCRSKTCCQLSEKNQKKDAQSEIIKNQKLISKDVLEDSIDLTNESKDTSDENSLDNEVRQDTPEPTETKLNTEINSNMMFLESLLPFFDEMTNRQNCRFRVKVLTMIDDILD